MDFVEFTEKIEDRFDELVPKSEINNIVNKSLKCISNAN